MDRIPLSSKKVVIFSPRYHRIKQLYQSSFPPQERISWLWMMWKSLIGRADFLAYFDGNQFVGFTYSLKSSQVYYLLFLAVPDYCHSKGYGSKILQTVAKEANNRPIFLVIEPLDEQAENYDIRLKRLKFYEQNGYGLTNYLYFENQEMYQVLTNQNVIDISKFEQLAKTIEQSGMRIKVQQSKN